jgi:NADP-dependent alcohol dehydrogenase
LIIKEIESFFRHLGLATRLHELSVNQSMIDEIEIRLNHREVAFGEMANVTGSVAKEILLACW